MALLLLLGPTSRYLLCLFLAIPSAAKPSNSKDHQKRIDNCDRKIQKLLAAFVMWREKKAIHVSRRRAAVKREERAKVAGERRGRGEKYPGHCLACV